jgi:hypothetical protein
LYVDHEIPFVSTVVLPFVSTFVFRCQPGTAIAVAIAHGKVRSSSGNNTTAAPVDVLATAWNTTAISTLPAVRRWIHVIVMAMPVTFNAHNGPYRSGWAMLSGRWNSSHIGTSSAVAAIAEYRPHPAQRTAVDGRRQDPPATASACDPSGDDEAGDRRSDREHHGRLGVVYPPEGRPPGQRIGEYQEDHYGRPEAGSAVAVDGNLL